MDQRNESSLPASLVNGRLEGLSVPELLWNLCRRSSTGVLHLTSRGITKKIYFSGGRIVFALSGDPTDRLGDLLLRDGLITLDQFEGALTQLSSGKRLGTILVGEGHLSPDNLVRGVLGQVKGIVLGMFPWEEGEYAFVESPLPSDEVITLGMRTEEIMLQGIRQIRSFSRIRESVGLASTRFRLAPAWREVLEGLDIRDGERMLLKRLDEAGPAGASVFAMCREVFLSNFEIYQALCAFRVLGIVEGAAASEEPFPGDAVLGRIERSTLAEVLVRLYRKESTGVLHMSRGSVERTLHLREGACVFATSNMVDDGLVAHLLRRGVISLADREETTRRLLSNKRVGTILLEMGVIDEGDLQATVREQLSEIIFDTFRWDEGDFCFIEGPLPTVEEITLNRTIEDLVFASVRRVTSWPRVRNGCGGLGVRLVLLPRYLSVLDKMTVGPEEWELISLLKTPKSILEICRESLLGDFRSCQILWALRLLDAVGEAPVEVSVDTALGVFDAPHVADVSSAIPVSEPMAAAELAQETEPEDEPEAEAARGPDPDPTPIPLSDADNGAEVISDLWRLAAQKRPDDATDSISREDVEDALRDADDELPRADVGEPETGVREMKVDDIKIDMRPDAPQESEPQALPSAEEDAPAEDRAPELDRTMRVPREAIESALRDQAPAPKLPPFVPPIGFDGDIASFNARHVILFRALRAEIGAGAANFVRSCRGSLDDGFAPMFESVELRADGSWDPDGLKRSVIEHRIENTAEGCQKFLDDELQRLRTHLGEARARALANQLSTIP